PASLSPRSSAWAIEAIFANRSLKTLQAHGIHSRGLAVHPAPQWHRTGRLDIHQRRLDRRKGPSCRYTLRLSPDPEMPILGTAFSERGSIGQRRAVRSACLDLLG